MKRNISILDYFNALQKEYILYKIRLKIYPYSKDKERFKTILKYKEEKILDIAENNKLDSIFSSTDKRNQIEKEVFDSCGVPKDFTKKDKYFFYHPRNYFSYKGSECKLISYDLEKQTAIINHSGVDITVHLSEIRRII